MKFDEIIFRKSFKKIQVPLKADKNNGQFTNFESKTFRTGAAIYTAVVVVRSTGPNSKLQVLLRSFQVTT
jgi:hypothetical protein